jgi:CheY-like chemotaxis protein
VTRSMTFFLLDFPKHPHAHTSTMVSVEDLQHISCSHSFDLGGSGLGLFISRRLTEMHGGAIGFASKPGVGSTFSFYVKSRMSALRPQIDRKESSEAVKLSIRAQKTLLSSRSCNEQDESPKPVAGDSVIPNKELHVLIVEDNLVNQRVLAKQLRNIGMQVEVANHGGEALDYLRKTKYCVSDGTGKPLALILMDWEMPGKFICTNCM